MISLVRKCSVSSSSSVSKKSTLFFSSSSKVSSETTHRVSILSFLKDSGFSEPQINGMIKKSPTILKTNPETLKSKLTVFSDNGFSKTDTLSIISKNPLLFHSRIQNRVWPAMSALKSTLGSTDATCKVLKKLRWFVKQDLEETMIPNIQYLKRKFEDNSSQVTDFLISAPRLFLLRPEIVSDGVTRVDELGLRYTSKMYLYAVRAACSMSNESLELKMSLFQDLGYSEEQVRLIFQRCPHIFGYSVNNINEKIRALLGSGRAGSSLSLAYMPLLSYSVEKRIKPRLKIIESLENSGALPKKLGLCTILTVSNKKFLERFVLSNSDDIGRVIAGIANKLDVKP